VDMLKMLETCGRVMYYRCIVLLKGNLARVITSSVIAGTHQN